jgi:hypothetical protein
LFLLIAAGWRRGWRHWCTDAMLLTVVLANVWSGAFYFIPEQHKEPWRAVVSVLEQEVQAGDVIVVTPPYAGHPLRRYGSAWVRSRIVAAPVSGSKNLTALLDRKPTGIWLVTLHSNVATPNIEAALQLAVWDAPQVGEMPALDEVTVVEDLRDMQRSDGKPIIGELMAHWGSADPKRHKVVVLGTLYEGFTTARSTITVRRFSPPKASER